MTGSPAPAAWDRALAWALVGCDVDLPDRVAPHPAALADALAAAGWPSSRIAEHAQSVRDAGEPWPHPIPPALRAGLGAAQLFAALATAREALAALTPARVSNRTRLDPDERRLVADIPPHHVPH